MINTIKCDRTFRESIVHEALGGQYAEFVRTYDEISKRNRARARAKFTRRSGKSGDFGKL